MIYVLEAGFFAVALESSSSGEPGFYAGYEYRRFGRVTIEKRGVTVDGEMWVQQAVVEGPLGGALQDWGIVRYRDGTDGEWLASSEAGLPLASREDRDVVAVALYRVKDQLNDATVGHL